MVAISKHDALEFTNQPWFMLPNIPAVIKQRAQATPEKETWFSKTPAGVWKGVTWRQYQEQIETYAAGFYELGVRRGDRVVLMFPNCFEWELSEKGLLTLGAIVVGVDPQASTELQEHVLKDSGAALLIVHNPRCLKPLSFALLLELKTIICAEQPEDQIFSDKKIMLWESFLHQSQGVQSLPSLPSGDDIATLVYTSGTTGKPKGIPYTHYQCIFATQSILHAFPSFNEKDVTVCLLPLSHLFQRIINLCTIAFGGSVYFISDPKQFQSDIEIIHPTLMMAVPRLFEKTQEAIEAKLSSIPLGDLIPASFIRRRILGGRMRLMITGAAPMADHTLKFYKKLGIPLYEAYGLSENIVPIAMNTVEASRDGSVGKPMPENILQIVEDGEILVKGYGVFPGYWQDTKSSELFTDDGFYKTGDIGYVDADGFLYLRGRKSDIIKTSTGRRISPGEIEQKLTTIPYVDIAIVSGDTRKSLVAILKCNTAIDPTYIKTMHLHLQQVNTTLAPYERITGALLTNMNFTPANGFLTSSLKVRRKFIQENLKNEIDSLYSKIELSGNNDTIVIESLIA